MNNTIYKDSNPISIDFFIYTPNKYRKYIGNFKRSDKTFRKEISNQHIFHEAKCYGIDAGLIPILDELGCQKVILKYTVNGDYYSTSYKKFIQKGWQYPRECNTKAKGLFQPSWIMNFKYWRIRDKVGNIKQEGKEVEHDELSEA